MSLASKRKPTTILGHLVILAITALIIFLFIGFIANFQINKISKINEEYLITSNYLVPENYIEYKIKLEELNQDKYTRPITEYLDLMLEAKKINRHLEYSQLETRCITRSTVARIEMQIQNKELLLEKFNNTYSKKLNKIYWNSYIDSLTNYDIEGLKEKALELEMCFDE